MHNDRPMPQARLFIPGGIVFRRPKKGETAHLIRGRDKHGPGSALILPDGGDGSDNAIPDWLDDENCGLFSPSGERLHIESKDKDVVIEAPDGSAKIRLGTNDRKPVARKDDATDDGFLTIIFNPGSGGASLTITHSAGDPPPGLPPPGTSWVKLTGKVNQGSDKVETE
jgi:hypothetical protein